MNHLKNEKSPYLQQHVNNPVNWYPWGEEAFEKAKKENKPVFLSIGYATCHWCHVMAHESFEDDSVAELMNRAFVNIKVDREERPDIDHTYMTICQMLTGRGGWPLTIIMTPEKEPFFAATYIPKNSRQKMLGMMDLITQIEKVWKEEPGRINKSVGKIKEGFSQSLQLGRSDQPFNTGTIKKAKNALRNRYDEVHGGFGGSPKFPSPHNLMFLLRNWSYGEDVSEQSSSTRKGGSSDTGQGVPVQSTGTRKKDEQSLPGLKLRQTGTGARKKQIQMVEKTCREMRLGGIWDHVGGGFHRYSTDQKWLLPHFEKMLYDQATLMIAYAEAWKKTDNNLFKTTCTDILDYLNEQMTSDEGGLYSAEDADSEGEEGKFYVWTEKELKEILTEKQFSLFSDLFNIKEEGNFRDESTYELTGKNIPHLKQTVAEYADQKELDSEAVQATIDECLQMLKKERAQRVRPQLDDKILTDWNGLMMAALASTGAIFEDNRFTEKATEIGDFLGKNCIKSDYSLHHRYKDGEAEIAGMADDYAFTVWGFIELYQTTFDPRYLKLAINLHQTFAKKFWDDEHGGFFFTADDGEEILGRQKEIYDGAIPSSNSVAALNAFRLARLTGNTEWEDQSEQILNAFSKPIDDAPAGYTFALITPLIKQQSPKEIVICAKEKTEEVDEILRYLQKQDRYSISVILKTEETEKQLSELSPLSAEYDIDDSIAVYICENFTCKMPVHSLGEVKEILE